MRYFLGIVSILGFYDFVIFPSRCNALILQNLVLYVFKNSGNILSYQWM